MQKVYLKMILKTAVVGVLVQQHHKELGQKMCSLFVCIVPRNSLLLVATLKHQTTAVFFDTFCKKMMLKLFDYQTIIYYFLSTN